MFLPGGTLGGPHTAPPTSDATTTITTSTDIIVEEFFNYFSDPWQCCL
jgi:hypothetical protein